MNQSQRKALVCTVGGSHEPILTAIRELKPDHVCFICSDDDAGTGRKGSWMQITGKGSVIKAHPSDDKPSLPNIPAQAGLAEGSFTLAIAPADDFDTLYEVADGQFLGLREEGYTPVADYTGGTKTMTAALVSAALDSDVKLYFVTGNRTDLIKVRSGTEDSAPASVANTRLRRRIQAALAAWQRHAYDDAAAMLRAITPPENPVLRVDLLRARDLSRGFALWDRFDHRGALDCIDPYRAKLGRTLAEHFGALQILAGAGQEPAEWSPRKEPLMICDLWRNAQRRAAQGRYDDAVARGYRIIEWSVQWLLRSHAGIDTSDVPADSLAPGMTLHANHTGKLQAGLFQAWELAAFRCEGELRELWRADGEQLRNLIKLRNYSILAHGYIPVGESYWREMSGWIGERLLPVLLGYSGDKTYRIARLPAQLPTSLAELLEADRP